MMKSGEVNALNMAARYLPPSDGGEGDCVPAVQVAGVMVLVYVDSIGRLAISADFDGSVLGDPTPVVVRMSGQVVWRSQEQDSEEGK